MEKKPAGTERMRFQIIKLMLLIPATLIFAAACNDSARQSVSAQEESGKEVTKSKKKPKQLKLLRKAVLDKVKGNMKSHTIYVPEGWKVSGAPLWPHPSLFKTLPSPRIAVTSPDGFIATIHNTAMFSDPRPNPSAFGARRPAELTSDGQGYMVKYRPDSTREWKSFFTELVIPQEYRGAKNIEVSKVSEVKEFTEILKKRNEAVFDQVKKTNKQARSFGLANMQSFEVKGYLIEATFEMNGKPQEFVGILGFYNMETKNQAMTQVRWGVEPNISYVGPKGKLQSQLPLLSTISGSARPTKSWIREVQNYVRASWPTRPPANFVENSVANTYSEILDSSHKSFRKRNGMVDAGQSKYVDSVHETSNYSYAGTTYQLPSGYDHVYTDNFDTIIMTNDSLFNPNVDLRDAGSWNKMSER